MRYILIDFSITEHALCLMEVLQSYQNMPENTLIKVITVDSGKIMTGVASLEFLHYCKLILWNLCLLARAVSHNGISMANIRHSCLLVYCV